MIAVAIVVETVALIVAATGVVTAALTPADQQLASAIAEAATAEAQRLVMAIVAPTAEAQRLVMAIVVVVLHQCGAVMAVAMIAEEEVDARDQIKARVATANVARCQQQERSQATVHLRDPHEATAAIHMQLMVLLPHQATVEVLMVHPLVADMADAVEDDEKSRQKM